MSIIIKLNVTHSTNQPFGDITLFWDKIFIRLKTLKNKIKIEFQKMYLAYFSYSFFLFYINYTQTKINVQNILDLN